MTLSVYGSIIIEGLDYEFDVLEGNGDYVAEVTEQKEGDQEALVVIVENKVKVRLFSNSACITIYDQEKSTSITLYSYDESVLPRSSGLFLDVVKSTLWVIFLLVQ